MAFTVQREQRNHDFAQAGRRARSMLEQDKKTIEAEEQRAKEYAQKPVTKPISEPVPQKKKENISFWEKLLSAFGDAGYSADTTTPLAMTNQAITDDYRKSNMQESKTAEAGGNIVKSAAKSAESAYENAAGTFLNKRSGTQIMGVTVADNAVSQEDKDKADAARKRNQESIYAKADKAAAAAAEASEKAKDNLGGSKAAGAFVDIASGGLQLGADMALNALLPGAGLANMGLRSYGSGSREARLDGASEGEQVAYGAAAAAVDVLTEKIFDVGKLFGGGAADDVAEKLIGKLAKTDAGRSVLRALTNAVGEGAEEAVADILNPAIRTIYDKGAAVKSSYTTAEGAKEMLAQSAYDAMIGAALSTFGTAAGIVKGIDAQKNAALRAGEPAANVNAEASAKPADAETIAAEAQADAAPVETAQDAPAAQEENAAPADIRETGLETRIAGIKGNDTASVGNASTAMENTLWMRRGTQSEPGWGETYGTAQEAFNEAMKRIDSGLFSAMEKAVNEAERGINAKENLRLISTMISAAEFVRHYDVSPAAAATVIINSYHNDALDSIRDRRGDLTDYALEQMRSIDNAVESYGSNPVSENDLSVAQNAEYPGNAEDATGMREPAQNPTQERATEAGQSTERDANRQPQEYTPEDHIDNRSDEYIAKRSTKSFQYNHPELHEHFERVAEDLAPMIYGSMRSDRYKRGKGTITNNSRVVQDVIDKTGLSRPEILRALDAIIKDNGAENYADAKRVEKALDSLLVDGYTKPNGEYVAPDAAYMEAKSQISGGTDPYSWEYYRDNDLSLLLGEITEEESYNDWRAERDAREAAKAAQEQSQNSDNFADVQQRETETDAGQRGTLPEGQGAKSAEFGYDEAKTQARSLKNLFEKGDREKLGLTEQDLSHKVEHDAEAEAKAQERFESDYEGEKADLFGEKRDWDKTDTLLADKIMGAELDKAHKSGSMDDYAEVARLVKRWYAQGTDVGQVMQMRQVLSKSPKLMEAEAIELLMDEKRTRKMSDEQRKKILDSVSQNAERLLSIEKGDVDGVVDLIKDMSMERRTNSLWSNKMGRTMEKALEQAKKLPDGESFLRDIAASQVRGIAYDYAKPSVLEQIKTYRYLSMLSKPATPARNLIGNMVYDPVEAVSNNIGVGLDMLLSKCTGTRSVAVDMSYLSKAKRKGMGEARLKSYIEMGLDASVSNARGKYGTGGSRSYKMTGNFLERFLSTWEKYSNYAMVTTDQMQKGGIQAEAQRGIDELEAKGKVAKGALDGRAEETARERTFQNDSKLAQATGVVRRGLNVFSIKDKRGGRFGVGDLILPFTNVPGNIASAAIQYSPAGFINAGAEVVKVLHKAKAGTLTAAEQAKAVTDFGRAFNGTMGIALFAVLAGAGVMNVAGDDDKDKEALEKSEGVSGTQLNLSALNRWIAGESTEWRDGDDLVSIGFLDPINAQMTYGALLADCYEEDGKITFGDVTRENLSSIYQSVMDLPAMSQFQEIENSLKYSKADNDGGKLADATLRYGASQVTSFIPNVVSGVAQGIDGTVRDTYNGDTVWENSLNAMKSKIPWLRETLPAALDNWGQEKKYTGTAAENFLNATLNPGSVTKYRTSAVNQELYRLDSLNIDVKYPEKKTPSDVSRNGKKVTLNQDEKRQYQMAYGQTAYDNIQKVIQSSVYKQSSDAEKAAAIQNLLKVATAAGKKKAKLDGSDTPSWTTKSSGSVADNAVYRAKLGTAKDTLPADARDRNGDVMQAIIKTVVGKRGGSDQLALNVMAQEIESGTLAKVETAYNGGYELKQIVDFYQAMYAKKPGTSQKKYKKPDLYVWAMQNGYTAKQFNQLWNLFGKTKK